MHALCEGEDFTLEKLVEIGLDQHAELVGDISSAASKELAIEQVLYHTNTTTIVHCTLAVHIHHTIH